MNTFKKYRRLLLYALKLAVGSSLAIYIATLFHLDYAISAGTITLLTIVTTKWETLRLSVYRLVTFVITTALAGLLFTHVGSEWFAYGIYIFILVLLCELLGWKATVSVNAVIGAHFLTHRELGLSFVLNEFALLVIGIVIAILLNLFHGNKRQKEEIEEHMQQAEKRLQMILGEVAAYLSQKEMQRNVWDDIVQLEKQLQEYVGEAYQYQNNTFQSHPQYYIDYFEMRTNQCNVLHNLHYEMKRIRQVPRQARVIADYILYLMDYVVERNKPDKQIGRLNEIFELMKTEPLPKTREEFENRALLYHILMDLEEFLMFKQRFVENLDEEQVKRYWEKKR